MASQPDTPETRELGGREEQAEEAGEEERSKKTEEEKRVYGEAR